MSLTEMIEELKKDSYDMRYIDTDFQQYKDAGDTALDSIANINNYLDDQIDAIKQIGEPAFDDILKQIEAINDEVYDLYDHIEEMI